MGSLKSRFVARDLKIWSKGSIANTHAEVPGMIAWRLIIARADLSRRRWYDYRTKTMKYGFLEGPTYGMQVCMKIWKLTQSW